MASNISYTKEDIRKIIDAAERFHPLELLGNGYQGMLRHSWSIVLAGKHYSWNNSLAFSKFLFDLTETNSIKEAYNVLVKWEETASSETAPEREVTTAEEVFEKTQTLSSTVPDHIWLKEMEERVAKKKLSGQTRRLVNEVKRAPKTFAQIKAKQIKEAYLAKVPNLSSQEKEIVALNAQNIAIDLTDRLLSLDQNQPDELSVLAALSNSNNETLVKIIPDENQRNKLVKTVQERALIEEHDRLIIQNTLSLVLEGKTLEEIYPDYLNQYKISDSPTEISFQPQDLMATAKETAKIQSNALNLHEDLPDSLSQGTEALHEILKQTPWYQKTESFLAEKATKYFASRGITISKTFSPVIESKIISFWRSSNTPILAGANVIKLFPTSCGKAMIVPIINNNFIRIVGRSLVAGGKTLSGVSIRFGGARITTLLGRSASGQITATVVRLTTKAGTKVITSGALATVLASLGSFAPIVGNVVGFALSWVAGEVISKIPSLIRKIKENAAPLFAMGALLFVPGALMGNFVLMAPGFVLMTIPVVAGGIGAGTIGTIGLRFGSLFFGGFFLSSFIIPLVIGFVAFIVFTVFILFIINSGAYIVPADSLTAENPYVKIEKTPDPEGPFENDQYPFAVTYTIKVTSKKSTLSNIGFEYICEVVKENASVNCPAIEGEIPNLPGEGEKEPIRLEPSKTYSFSYKVTYNNRVYNDTLITDTLAVKADVEDGTSMESAASATIKIGNPPEECPIDSWPIAGNGGLYAVTQGPHARACSHGGMAADAIDIGVNGATVVATHSGVASVVQDDCYGKYVEVLSSCGSTVFASRYAHMGVVSVKPGQRVTRGQVLGISDNTGRCTTGAHLHFDFRAPGGGAVSVPKMTKPYLIRDIPYGCCNSWNGIYCN
jgi:uncharacterized protein YxeA